MNQGEGTGRDWAALNADLGLTQVGRGRAGVLGAETQGREEQKGLQRPGLTAGHYTNSQFLRSSPFLTFYTVMCALHTETYA